MSQLMPAGTSLRTISLDPNKIMTISQALPMIPDGQWFGLTMLVDVNGEPHPTISRVLCAHPEICKVTVICEDGAYLP